MIYKKEKFKIIYKSNVDFLTWEVTVEAKNEEEARQKISEKGKIVCIEKLL